MDEMERKALMFRYPKIGELVVGLMDRVEKLEGGGVAEPKVADKPKMTPAERMAHARASRKVKQ